jgi:hypothetical protein
LTISQTEFETILTEACGRLTIDVVASNRFHKANEFETRVREVIQDLLAARGVSVKLLPIAQSFPDIVFGSFGVEVKATESDSWRCIANSVSEGQRASGVEKIYVVYGKMGGQSEVRWADYGKSIMHVRTSHVPRFEIEIGSSKCLFDEFGISYDEFRTLPMEKKMPFVRLYAKSRLKDGERLWWLDDKPLEEQEHSLPLNIRIYMELSTEEKRQYRAEAALLCPQVVKSGSHRGKYSDAVSYLMTYRGVLCPQARDLFSAGSVAGKERGGNYVQRSLMDIQQEMLFAARQLDDKLFEEYWGKVPPRDKRIKFWLDLADRHAKTWKPSSCMFVKVSD